MYIIQQQLNGNILKFFSIYLKFKYSKITILNKIKNKKDIKLQKWELVCPQKTHRLPKHREWRQLDLDKILYRISFLTQH